MGRYRRIGALAGALALLTAACGDGDGELASGNRASTGDGSAVDAAPLDLAGEPTTVENVRMVPHGGGVLVVAYGGMPDVGPRAAWFESESASWTEVPAPPVGEADGLTTSTSPVGPLVFARTCLGRPGEDGQCLGGGSRVDVVQFDVAERRWRSLAPLTPEASSLLGRTDAAVGMWPGGGGSMQLLTLVGTDARYDRELWTLDLEGDRWTAEVAPPAGPAAFCRPERTDQVFATVPSTTEALPPLDEGARVPAPVPLVLRDGTWHEIDAGSSEALAAGPGLRPALLCLTDGAVLLGASAGIHLPVEGGPTPLPEMPPVAGTPGAPREVPTPHGFTGAAAERVVLDAAASTSTTDLLTVSADEMSVVASIEELSAAAVTGHRTALVLQRDLDSGKPTWSVLDLEEVAGS